MDGTTNVKHKKKRGAERPKGHHYHLRLDPELNTLLKEYTRANKLDREVQSLRQMIRRVCEQEGLAA
jgi:predicted N-acyltransferase